MKGHTFRLSDTARPFSNAEWEEMQKRSVGFLQFWSRQPRHRFIEDYEYLASVAPQDVKRVEAMILQAEKAKTNKSPVCIFFSCLKNTGCWLLSCLF